MELSLINIDNFFINVRETPRLYPGGVALDKAAFLPAKTGWIDTSFPTWNFSFILEGQGEYHYPGGSVRVIAPYVITQQPGVPVRYGPTDGTWAELYLVFHCRDNPLRGWDPNQPAWPIDAPGEIIQNLTEIAGLADKTSQSGTADLLDRLAETLVLRSLLKSIQQPHPESPENALVHLMAKLQKTLPLNVDWSAEAHQLGLSEATFRRLWNKHFNHTPHKMLTLFKLNQACRLLSNTPIPIAQIAYRCGFEDPLYFSRKFSESLKIAPSQYRLQNRQKHAAQKPATGPGRGSRRIKQEPPDSGA